MLRRGPNLQVRRRCPRIRDQLSEPKGIRRTDIERLIGRGNRTIFRYERTKTGYVL